MQHVALVDPDVEIEIGMHGGVDQFDQLHIAEHLDIDGVDGMKLVRV